MVPIVPMHSSLPVYLLFIFILLLYFKAVAREKRPIAALLAIFAAVIMFWAVFKQNGTALTIWADNYTNREVNGTTADVFKGLRQAKDCYL